MKNPLTPMRKTWMLWQIILTPKTFKWKHNKMVFVG